jgi:putative tryptophan/tyrosine transport system substrate-binding protein
MKFDRLKRRDFFTLLGGAVAWPLPVRAQPAAGKVPRIGFLQSLRSSENIAAFMQGLQDAGYIDGRNAIVEARYYETMLDRLAEFANELVALKCDVIFAAAPYAIQAAMDATSTIPVVGVDLESDPVARGWARSLAQPGGNLTGLFLDLSELGGKQIELLKEAVPTLSHLAVLWDSTIGTVQFRATEAAARVAGVTLQSLSVQRPEDFNDAFDSAIRERVHGMVILSSPLINGQRSQIVEWALKTRVPTISLFTQFPGSGGLMAYGPNLAELYKGAASYVDRILKGAKAGELPIQRPTRFDLVINLKTAKALGLDLPWFLQQRADEVIE